MTTSSENRQRVVAVVGGGGAIGQAIAQQYAKLGFRIALLDRDPGRLELAARELEQYKTRSYPCDITDEESCQESIETLIKDHGRLDILVHSAGLTHVSPFASTAIDVLRRVMEVNFFGVVTVTKAALPALIESKGQIVVLSSICGIAPLIGRTGYCASKHALHGFFDTLRCELAPKEVSVLLACPSFVASDFATRGLAGDGTLLPFQRSTLGKPLSPEEVAAAIVTAAVKRRSLLVLTWRGRLTYWLTRLLPGTYQRLMSKRFAVELSRVTKS